jgi:hypothetical protein
VIENVLYGNGLWSLLAVYITVLGLWYYIYIKTRHLGNAELRNQKTKKATLMLIGMLVLFLITNTTLDVVRSLGFSQKTLPRIIELGLYFLNIGVFVGIPGIAFLALGRKLEVELSRYNSINGVQIQDGYIRKITFLTTASCVIAFSTLAILITAFIILSVLSSQHKLKPAMALSFHVLYRVLEIAYMLSVLGIFYFKVNPKVIGAKYVRMK